MLIIPAGIFAQNLVPGTYRYTKDQTEAKVSLNGDEAILKAWNLTISGKKVSANKYLDPTNSNYIEVLSEDLIAIGNEKYDTQEKLQLYAPDNSTTKEGLTEFYWNDNKYFAVEDNLNSLLVGEYLYKNGDPKIILKSDKTGFYQRHGTEPTPISWWGIETNYKGEIQKLEGAGNYKMMLVVKFGPNAGQFDQEDTYERMQIAIDNTNKRSIILGERVYNWK